MRLCEELQPQIATLLEDMAQSVGSEAAGFAVVNRDESIGYCVLYNVADHLGRLSVSKGIDILGMVLATEQTTIIDDYARFPKAVSAWIQVGAQSACSAPVVVDNNLVGAVTALSLNKKRHFTSDDIKNIEEYAKRVGLLIGQARQGYSEVS